MNVEWVESMPLQKLKKELKGENIEEEREEGRELWVCWDGGNDSEESRVGRGSLSRKDQQQNEF